MKAISNLITRLWISVTYNVGTSYNALGLTLRAGCIFHPFALPFACLE